MKFHLHALLFLSLFLIISTAFGQDFINLKPGESQEINGIAVSYIAAKKKTRKGEDLYRVTVSLTNHGGDFIHLFPMAKKYFIKKVEKALAYVQFTNATGTGLSTTSAKIYSKPIRMKVPIDCLITPAPTDPDAPKSVHTIQNYIIGTRFLSGSTINGTYNVRVSHGDFPKVRVMIQ